MTKYKSYHELKSIAAFHAVAESGNFSRAAKDLGVSPSYVSQQVTHLEERLKAKLLHRSTRSVSLTATGEDFRQYASAMVNSAEDAVQYIANENSGLRGHVKIVLPQAFSGSSLEDLILDFAAKHADINFEVQYNDRMEEIAAMGADLAITIGAMSGSQLVSRKIGLLNRRLVCSPEMLGQFREIKNPDQIDTNHFIRLKGIPETLTFQKGGETRTIDIKNGRLLVGNLTSLKHSLCAGMGVQRLPEHTARELMSIGKLVHLLPDWKIEAQDINLIRSEREKRNSASHELRKEIVDFFSNSIT